MNDQLILKSLNLHNFATFQSGVINFSAGFNAIIGETGSGKSLILDALQLIFGAKASKKLIRKDADFTTIEATFSAGGKNIENFFNETGYPFDNNEIIIKRIIYRNGSSKNYLNFQSCRRNDLVNFSKVYIDLVGQFENQKLLSETYQLQLLDEYAKLTVKVEKYKVLWNQYLQLQRKLQELEQNQNDVEMKLDYLKYQISEIEELGPSIEDEEELIEQKNFLLNYEKKTKIKSEINYLLSESERSLISTLQAVKNLVLQDMTLFDEKASDYLIEIENLVAELDNSVNASDFQSIDDINFEDVLERLDQYQKIKRKFGGTIESTIAAYDKFKEELAEIEDLDHNLDLITSELEEKNSSLQIDAEKLHKARMKAAKKLSKDLTKNVRELKMNGASIDISLETREELTADGLSKLHFLAETNPGEGYHKIKETASGGELSRILLALRQILSSHDSISIFLFDEIDAGIGGSTAMAIGKSLAAVAASSQVIAITHLPQIAHFADQLVHVSKLHEENDKETRTYSNVKEIFGGQKDEFIKSMNPIH